MSLKEVFEINGKSDSFDLTKIVGINKDVESNNIQEETSKESTSFTLKQKVSLCMLATVEFTSYCSMSIMAPFYPREATAKGMSETLAGFVFSFYALVVFLSSPIFGKVLPKLGVKFTFIFGILTSGVCNIVFGTLQYIDNTFVFTLLSFIIRGTEALGASAYSTAGYVLVINIFPKNGGVVRGILETFVGLGMSVGPAMGGLLFAIGGFGLPFYVVGMISVMVAPINFYVLSTSDDYKVEVQSGSYLNILKLPSVIITCCVVVVVSATWGFLDPTLEPHLRMYNLNAANIGLIFLLLSATYGVFSPIWGFISDKIKSYWTLMPLGLISSSVVLLFLGPSPVLSFLSSSLLLTIISLSILGVFVAMSVMPTYQGILDGAIDGGFKDNLGTHSIVAGLWSSSYSLGEIIGPALGGVLLQHWGFPRASTALAGMNFIFAIVTTAYFIIKKEKCSKCDVNTENVIQ
ncbi:MFS-type transporter SLC18B1-like [Onthophagus taurus]|uniref:MFS-type transporter SLC18B1-like n=1 Tax=Onthophagus taurus TaxID=166361 RepID=UPI000C203E62|nr:MFS-type transporter SLC18B1-like [Onthophagus taurus]